MSSRKRGSEIVPSVEQSTSGLFLYYHEVLSGPLWLAHRHSSRPLPFCLPLVLLAKQRGSRSRTGQLQYDISGVLCLIRKDAAVKIICGGKVPSRGNCQSPRRWRRLFATYSSPRDARSPSCIQTAKGSAGLVFSSRRSRRMCRAGRL